MQINETVSVWLSKTKLQTIVGPLIHSWSPVIHLNEAVMERALEAEERHHYPTLWTEPWEPCKYLQSITLYTPGISLEDRYQYETFFKALMDAKPPPIRHMRLGYACMDTLITIHKQQEEHWANPEKGTCCPL